MRIFLIALLISAIVVIAFLVVSVVLASQRETQMRRIEQWVPGTKPAALPPKGYDWSYDTTLETWELKKNE